jgi:hypothetical protein
MLVFPELLLLLLLLLLLIYLRAPQQMLRTYRRLEGLLCNPMMKMMRIFLLFHFYGEPVEWNWQGKTEVLGEKPVPVPLCTPQISHGPTWDQTRGLRGERPATNRLSHGTAFPTSYSLRKEASTSTRICLRLNYASATVCRQWFDLTRIPTAEEAGMNDSSALDWMRPIPHV